MQLLDFLHQHFVDCQAPGGIDQQHIEMVLFGVIERGVGNVFNALLPPGSGGFRFQNTWADELLPALDDFRPQLLLISAGFDAHMRDPLADLMLETEDFGWLTRQLREVAELHAAGRIVSMLEGGYDLDALRECTVVHVEALR